MSLQVVSVKEEPGWVGKYETDLGSEEETGSKAALLKDGIKEEEDWDAVGNAAHTELYNDHLIKDELVLGPELLYPLDKAQVAQKLVDEFWEKASKESPEQIREESTEPGCAEPCLLTHGEPSKTSQALPLGDCFVKLERLPLHNVKKPSSNQTLANNTFSHIEAVLKLKNKKKVACKKKIFICDTCGKQFQEKMSLVHHVQLHMRGKPYACDICQKTFACKKYLKRHVLVHIDKPFSCNICNTKFSLMNRLIRHQVIHRTDMYVSCQVCNKKFAWKKNLERHKLIHTREKAYNCKACGKRFRHRGALAIHLREHNANKPQAFEESSKNTSHGNLNTLKVLHSVEKPRSCDICQKQFSYISSLINHKRGHTELIKDKNREILVSFQCEICQTKCTTKGSFNRHKRSHLKEQPFSCAFCKRQFSRKDSLVCHEHTHIKDKTNETCGKQFSSSSYYKKILKVYSCEICEKKFTTTTQLAIHNRIHTGEKPYACEICDKSFRHQSTLTSHLRRHTGQKPYACDMCESRYITSSNLRQHKRSAHFLV